MNREWRKVDCGNGSCSVSNDGLFRNDISGYVSKVNYPDSSGYLHVTLNINGKAKRVKLHRLVATAFLPNPDGKPHVHHKDGNRTNNRVENLEWVTHDEHSKRTVELGQTQAGVETRRINESNRTLIRKHYSGLLRT